MPKKSTPKKKLKPGAKFGWTEEDVASFKIVSRGGEEPPEGKPAKGNQSQKEKSND